MEIQELIRTVSRSASKNSHTILMVLGLFGVGTVGVLSAKGTEQAIYRILDEETLAERRLTTKEKILLCWPYYVPVVVTGAATMACIFGLNTVHLRRQNIIAGAYMLSEKAVNAYREKIAEVVGPKSAQEIDSAIARSEVAKAGPPPSTVIITGTDCLCLDATSGRYFKSSPEKLRQIENRLNHRLFTEMTLSLNEFYDALGLSHIAIGDDLGWNMYNMGPISLSYTSTLSESEEPCLVVSYHCVSISTILD